MMVESHSRQETVRLGEAIGRRLQPGDVVAITGELGAGKTALVQGLARGLGCADRVTSPTFTIVNEYGDGRLFHVDFYRLDRREELDHIGFDDYFARGGVIVVEWADRFPEALPAERLDVRIEVAGEDERRFHFGGARAALAADALQ